MLKIQHCTDLTSSDLNSLPWPGKVQITIPRAQTLVKWVVTVGRDPV